MTATRHLIITGHVQGVGFRYAMARKAAVLAVRGWVRNRHDGGVEAVIQGDTEAIAAMIAWARIGPRAARVEGIAIEDAQGEHLGFEIRDDS